MGGYKLVVCAALEGFLTCTLPYSTLPHGLMAWHGPAPPAFREGGVEGPLGCRPL